MRDSAAFPPHSTDPSPVFYRAAVFPGVTFTLALQPRHRAVNPAPLIGARGKFMSEEVGKDGTNGVMETAPSGAAPLAAASREDGRASGGSLQPPPAQGTSTKTPMLLGVGPQGEHGWEPEQEPPVQLQGSPGLTPVFPPGARSRSSPRPVGWRSPEVGAVGTGHPQPALGCRGLGCFRLVAGNRGVCKLTSQSQSSGSWSGFSWGCLEASRAQPSPAPSAGPVQPTEGRGARGTSLRAPHLLADRETEARSTPASWEAAPGCPPALQGPSPAGLLPPHSPPQQLVAGTSREKSLAAKQTKGASSQGYGKPGQGTGAGRARSTQGCSWGRRHPPAPQPGRETCGHGQSCLCSGAAAGNPSPRGLFFVPRAPRSILSRASSHGQKSQS